MGNLIQDLRFALRQLRSHKGFTLAAVLCLALGIGANSATFSFANAVLLQAPGLSEPQRLVRLFVNFADGLQHGTFSYPDYVDLRDHSQVFSAVVAERPLPFHLSSGDRNEHVWGSIVSGNYFSGLGINVPIGRGFLPEEDRPGAGAPATVISHGLWKRQFGSDPAVVGRSALLNGHPFTIVGVTPERFRGANVAVAPELWVPMAWVQPLTGNDPLQARGDHWIPFVIARLKPGITFAQAEQATRAFMANLAKEFPDTSRGKSIELYPEAQAGLHPVVRDRAEPFIGLMFAVVGMVLLLACANVAGLLLARYATRRKEIGLRLALGARRGRLIRQLLVESTVLSSLAGALGLLLALLLIRVVQSFRPPSDLPLRLQVELDLSVLAFTCVAGALTGLVFGLLPALLATRQDLIGALKEGECCGGAKASRLRQALVAAQMAVSLILLIGAGLTIASLRHAGSLDLGFDPNQQVVAVFDLDLQGYDPSQGRQFRRSLRANLETLPGVVAAGFAERLPLQLNPRQVTVVPEGHETPADSNDPGVEYNVVDQGYFAAMAIPILQGRALSDSDDQQALPVVVVNQAFAERFWPGEDPIGQQVYARGAHHTTVGLVPTGKYFSLGEDPKAYLYFSSQQYYGGATALHLRTSGDPATLVGAIRTELRRLDPTLPVTDLGTMRSALGFALLPARLAAYVVSAFAALALLLATVGLYGMVSYSVSQGRREIGIRMALGADTRQILVSVLGAGVRLTLIGLGAGLVGGLVLGRATAGLLYHVSPAEPTSFLCAASVLAAVTLVAAFVPARRATRVDPAAVLRAE